MVKDFRPIHRRRTTISHGGNPTGRDGSKPDVSILTWHIAIVRTPKARVSTLLTSNWRGILPSYHALPGRVPELTEGFPKFPSMPIGFAEQEALEAFDSGDMLPTRGNAHKKASNMVPLKQCFAMVCSGLANDREHIGRPGAPAGFSR